MGYYVQILLVVIALSAYSIEETEALECYDCTSLFEKTCGEDFGDATKKTGCAQCSKIMTKSGDTTSIVRSCLSVNTGVNDCKEAEAGGAEVSTCFCDSELCNSSSYNSVSMVTSICAGLFVLLAKFM